MTPRFAQSSLQGLLFGLIAFGAYATHDVAIKHLGQTYAPFQTIFFATLFSMPLLVGYIALGPQPVVLRPVYPGWIIARIVASIFGTVGVFYAFSVLKFAETYTILFTTPLFITAFSVPILGEKVGLRRWGAVLLGFVGVLVALDPGVTTLGLPHVAAFIGAMSAAFIFISLRKIGQEESTAVLILYASLVNLLVMAVAMAFVYKPMPLIDMAENSLISILGFIAMLFMIAAYRRADAAVVAPTQYSQLLWAFLYGALLFGETVGKNVLLGAAIIIASGVYITLREARLRRDEAEQIS